MIITIDGPAGSGKSTIAKQLAKRLNILHFNSGSLFRGIAAYLRHVKFNFSNLTPDTKFNDISLEVKYLNNEQHVFINGNDFSRELRDNEISKLSPLVGENIELRSIIDKCQRDFCSKHDILIEGRDVGTYVFPNAEHKIYLDCSLEVRAKRRFLQEQEKGSLITLEQIKSEIKARDDFDKNKKIVPFVIPKNAIVIDSSNLSIDETIDKIIEKIKNQ